MTRTDPGPDTKSDSPASVTRRIARDIAAYLKNHPDTCADISVSANDHPWVRYRNGEWEYATYGEWGTIHFHRVSEETVLKMLENEPYNLIPVAEAYRWGPSDETVWQESRVAST